MVERLMESVRLWARGRLWQSRAPLVVACAWLGIALLRDSSTSTIFAAIDLGIHEAGHVVFRFGGEVVCALGGSLLQCLVPALAAVALARRPDWFGVAFCGVWLGVNLYEVARYMGDARAMALQLVTIGGGDARHDWNFIFEQWSCLRADTAIAGAVRLLAFLVTWTSIAASGALVFLIWRSRADANAEEAPSLGRR